MTPIRLMRLLVLFATLLAPAMMKLTDAELAEIASAVPAGAVKGTRYPEAQMASLYI